MLGRMLLYIDPGTGGMLFTVLIGLLGGVIYFFSSLFVKLKYSVGGKEKSKTDSRKQSLVFFSDHKRYWNTYEPILDELERRGIKAAYLTMSEDDPVFTKQYTHITGEYIGNGNKAFSRLGFLNAGIVFSSTPGLDVLQWKRSKNADFYIHIPHACSDITIYRMFGIDYFDAILLSGEYQINQVRQLEKLRNLPEKELVLVGVPYMDAMRKRLEEETREPDDRDSETSAASRRRTILVAPSWGDSGLLSRYGSALLDELLKTGYRIVVRPHPQSFTAEAELMDSLMKKYAGTDLEWNRDNDNFEILKTADLMISDFSGVIFDFALVFDKPFLYTESHMDKSPYDCAWIDEELWVYETLPKIGRMLKEDDFSNIKQVIDDAISNPQGKENRDLARAQTWVSIGESKNNVVEYILNKLKELGYSEVAE